jgi:hypothetical protein
MPRFRLPTLSEIFGLFYRSRSVASAISTFTGAVKRLEDVALYHEQQRAAKVEQSNALAARAEEHGLEAQSATAIASKVKALIT